MRKGVVLEVDERFLTLLTPEGEFLKARKQNYHYEIGQEIDFFPLPVEEKRKQSFFSILNSFRGKSIVAAALAFVLVFVSFLSFNNNDEVYAYVSMDINPSLELGVNEKLQVIDLIPYNEDGKSIITEIDNWKKKDLEVVSEKILLQLKEKGYLQKHKEIVIGTVHTGKVKEKAEKKLAKTVDDIKAGASKEQAVVKTIEASKKDREQAKENGLTAGKFVEAKQKAKKKPSIIIPTKKKEPEKKVETKNTAPNKQKSKSNNKSKEKLDNTNKNLRPNEKKQNNKSENINSQNNRFKSNKGNVNGNSNLNKEKKLPPGLEKKKVQLKEKKNNLANRQNATNGQGFRLQRETKAIDRMKNFRHSINKNQKQHVYKSVPRKNNGKHNRIQHNKNVKKHKVWDNKKKSGN
ncbi:anti-sigma factor domain-containing protein [Bacillus sp. 31A1R]|uniref:Anti-sigma factor domain-containing protein n=1 Tax=Robertmurraya mangrovi TaxID=3098077 RepID=A0ABU5ITM5_9BACI|nr:anti-sigma factor domain-containing protein [Bacillus sp. 31A1R]MDZ5470510.1 anti-sigma factor domain-containing protein [Bacillus sp. 31A1R]